MSIISCPFLAKETIPELTLTTSSPKLCHELGQKRSSGGTRLRPDLNTEEKVIEKAEDGGTPSEGGRKTNQKSAPVGCILGTSSGTSHLFSGSLLIANTVPQAGCVSLPLSVYVSSKSHLRWYLPPL